MESLNNLQISEYEKQELEKIHEWKSPKLNYLGKKIKELNDQVDKNMSFINDYPIVKKTVGFVKSSAKVSDNFYSKTVGKASEGVMSLLNDLSQKTVNQDSIIEEYKKNGIEVEGLEDIATHDLEDIDKTIGYLALKYNSLATAEGLIAGGASFVSPAVATAAIPVDVIALLTLNLRAIGEYATYCGYDVNSQHERLFILNILLEASSTSEAAKSKAMKNLVKIAKDTAGKKTWKELKKNSIVRVIEGVSKVLGVRLTKAKLANIIPAIGAAVNSGYNAYYTNRVCEAAYNLYRERFLADKYNSGNMIEETVEAPEDYIVIDE